MYVCANNVKIQIKPNPAVVKQGYFSYLPVHLFFSFYPFAERKIII